MLNKNDLTNIAIEDYLSSISKTHSAQVVQRTRSRLQQFCQIAKEQNIDFLNIGGRDAIKVVESLTIIGHSYLSDVDNTLVRFLDWCHENGYRKDKTIARFGYEEIDLSNSIQKTHFQSPLDFSEFLDKYYEPLNFNLIENSHRVFLWLIYMGVDAKDTLKITKYDVVLNKLDHYIIYNNKKIEIPLEAIRTFEYALSSYSFVKIFRNGYKVIDYANPDSLVGYSGNKPFNTIQHYINIKDVQDSDKGKLRFNTIYRSGLYYRMYLREVAGEDIDFLQIVQDTNSNKHDMRYYRRSEKYLINDYRDWKRAFNY